MQGILERSYDFPMSKEEADRFRVAFVVFVVSNLLVLWRSLIMHLSTTGMLFRTLIILFVMIGQSLL